MRSMVELCLVGLALPCLAGARNMQRPELQKGVSVEMPIASHVVEMKAADEPATTVVTVTSDGRVFVGIKTTELSALSSLSGGTVYVKADARVQYQKVLAVLDALHGKQVVLLTAPPKHMEKGRSVPPYGMKLKVSQ